MEGGKPRGGRSLSQLPPGSRGVNSQEDYQESLDACLYTITHVVLVQYC